MVGNDMVWPTDAIANIREVTKAAAKNISDADYLRLRAINQAYMEHVGVDEVTLYRGTDGKEGEKIAAALRKTSHKKATLMDAPIAGYTPKKSVADDFGFDVDGVTVKRTVRRSDIIIHEDLLAGVTRGFRYEREMMVSGGKLEHDIKDMRF